MSRFTDEQKKIALVLLHSPKTVEELNKQLNIPFDDLNHNLKQMVKLKLVKVEGYPQKYKLMDKQKLRVLLSLGQEQQAVLQAFCWNVAQLLIKGN